MVNLDDAFGGEVKPIPLEEALEEPEVEEYTKEDLRLIELGFDLDISKHYTKKKLTTKDLPYKDFFVWYLERATLSYLSQLHIDQLPETFQKLVAEEMESDELTKLLKINAENSVYIEQLEAERAEMQRALKGLEAEKMDLLQGVKKLNGVAHDTQEDKLYKKIQELQVERDDLKEQVELWESNKDERLEWLYEFMSNMSFCDVDGKVYQPTIL
jgi:hypothetical protein